MPPSLLSIFTIEHDQLMFSNRNKQKEEREGEGEGERFR
jgi:hypothetical protein